MLSAGQDNSVTTKRLPHSSSLLNFNVTSLNAQIRPSKSFSNVQVSYGRRRRRSLNEKLMAKEEQQNLAFFFCLLIRILLLCFAIVYIGYKFCAEQVFDVLMHDLNEFNFETSVVPQIHTHTNIGHHEFTSHIYPSLNVLDYWDYAYPIFPRHFPHGISRTEMPQLVTASESAIWQNFQENVNIAGGKLVLYHNFDLRRAKPLQSQISGNILYNIVLEALKEEVSRDFFKSRIILIKSSRRERQNNGKLFPENTFFILDGHHTTFASILCAVPQTKLRLGNLYKGSKICGNYFDTKQDIHVVEGLGLLEVRELAIAAGASTGQGLSFQSNSSVT